MKVILNDHVEHLGERGATIEVKPGFARNYLIPKGLAYRPTAANLARFKQEQKRWEVKEATEKVEAEAQAVHLTGIELTFKRRAGEGDALYGSVTSSDVAEALHERGIKIDRRRIELAQHIKRLGTFTAEIHLHREVRVPLTLHVEPEAGESGA
jgi:large subunit ribosomal protein L9